jgi:glycosyltransferase involved in cell wall biosynthesis
MAGIASTDRTSGPKPLRILHVTWRLSPTGGIPLVIRALIEHNDPERCEVHVATVRPPLEEDGLADLAGRATIHTLGFRGDLGLISKLRAALGFARLQRRLRADAVHAHSGTAVLALGAAFVRRRTARLLDVHDAPGSGRHGGVTDRVEGFLCRRAGFVPIVHSTSVRDDVARIYDLPLDRPSLVPLGIDVDSFAPAAQAADDGPPVVLYVARVVPTKNVDLFVDLAAAVGPRARFVVVGDGSELERIRERIRSEGLDHVTAIGPRVGQPLVEWYQQAAVFVSTSDYEGFGLAVVEAMATATPVVAVAVGGVTDLVEHGETGWLVPTGEIDELSRCVVDLLDDALRAESMGQAGVARARAHFDVRVMASHYLDVYERFAGRSKDPS